MYSTHNEGKYAVPERSFRTLKNKIYKYMTSISKKMYIDKLDDIFAKCLQKVTLQNEVSEEVFENKKVKYIVPWTYTIIYFNDEEIVEKLYEKKLQKINQTEFRVKKVIKRKGEKIYVKWKGYDDSFNSRIDKKRYHYIK